MDKARRLLKPSIKIAGQEYQCVSNEFGLEPGDEVSWCDNEWEFEIDLLLSFGPDGTWNHLKPLRDQLATVELVLWPTDDESASNPTCTFQIQVPPVPFATKTSKRNRMKYTLKVKTEAEPVFAEGV